MLHDLFTIGVNRKCHGGWILLLPTVDVAVYPELKISVTQESCRWQIVTKIGWNPEHHFHFTVRWHIDPFWYYGPWLLDCLVVFWKAKANSATWSMPTSRCLIIFTLNFTDVLALQGSCWTLSLVQDVMFSKPSISQIAVALLQLA